MSPEREVVKLGLLQIPDEGLNRMKQWIEENPGKLLLTGQICVEGDL